MKRKIKNCETCGKILPPHHKLNTCFGSCEKKFMGESGKRTFYWRNRRKYFVEVGE